jgi:hypothetical protein
VVQGCSNQEIASHLNISLWVRVKGSIDTRKIERSELTRSWFTDLITIRTFTSETDFTILFLRRFLQEPERPWDSRPCLELIGVFS